MSLRNVIAELSSYYEKSMDTELPPLIPFEKKLRVSGFPYCGLKHAYETLDEEKPNLDGAMKAFYCDVGTAAHLIFQRWLGSHGQIYGDWKCRNPKCGAWRRLSSKSVCRKCGSEMSYEELTVYYRTNVSGHVDGLFLSKNGKFYVIDYKTSSTRAIYQQKKEPTFPYAKNRVQIESYCALLEERFDVEISGWMLLYIARDNPKVFKIVGDEVSAEHKHRTLQKIRRYDRHYTLVKNGLTHETLDTLIKYKTCKTREFCSEYMSSCPLAPICFTDGLSRYMHRLLDDLS